MNWSGGARSRAKKDNDRQKQKDFFAKMKQAKLARLAECQDSSKPVLSKDILYFHTVDHIFQGKRKTSSRPTPSINRTSSTTTGFHQSSFDKPLNMTLDKDACAEETCVMLPWQADKENTCWSFGTQQSLHNTQEHSAPLRNVCGEETCTTLPWQTEKGNNPFSTPVRKSLPPGSYHSVGKTKYFSQGGNHSDVFDVSEDFQEFPTHPFTHPMDKHTAPFCFSSSNPNKISDYLQASSVDRQGRNLGLDFSTHESLLLSGLPKKTRNLSLPEQQQTEVGCSVPAHFPEKEPRDTSSPVFIDLSSDDSPHTGLAVSPIKANPIHHQAFNFDTPRPLKSPWPERRISKPCLKYRCGTYSWGKKERENRPVHLQFKELTRIGQKPLCQEKEGTPLHFESRQLTEFYQKPLSHSCQGLPVFTRRENNDQIGKTCSVVYEKEKEERSVHLLFKELTGIGQKPLCQEKEGTPLHFGSRQLTEFCQKPLNHSCQGLPVFTRRENKDQIEETCNIVYEEKESRPDQTDLKRLTETSQQKHPSLAYKELCVNLPNTTTSIALPDTTTTTTTSMNLPDSTTSIYLPNSTTSTTSTTTTTEHKWQHPKSNNEETCSIIYEQLEEYIEVVETVSLENTDARLKNPCCSSETSVLEEAQHVVRINQLKQLECIAEEKM